MSHRLAFANCRNHVPLKVRIAGQHETYLSVHDDEQLTQMFLLVKGAHCSLKFDVSARLLSLALQYSLPLEKVADLLAGAKFTPCAPISGHEHIKSCLSLPDAMGPDLLAGYCDRCDWVMFES